MSLNKFSKNIYKLGRITRWSNSINKSFKSKSIKPFLIRIMNVLIGRHIVSKLWLKNKK